MKQLLISLSILLFSITTFAQNPERLEKIKQAHIAYISSNVTMTSEQSQKFWPLYNELSEARQKLLIEQRQIKKALRQHKKGKNVLDDATVIKHIDRSFEIKEQIITLEKKYKEKFKVILDANQLLSLYKAEREFLRKLRKRAAHRGEHH